MRILSAVDAISPAVSRTRDLLFRPFQWGTFLKLCAVAVLTEGVSGRSNWWKGGGSPGAHWDGGGMIFNIPPQTVAMIVAACIAGLILGIAIFYLVTRLRFALFECLTHDSTEIRPGWHIYREPAQRFFWVCLGVALGFLALAAAVLYPSVAGLLRRVHEHGGRLTPGDALEYIAPMIPVLMLLGLVAVAADIILRDFMLPHMALDNASAGEALEAVWNHIAAEKGAFFVYAVLRILLPVAAMIALVIALLIPGVILFGGGGVLIALLKAAAVNGSSGVALGSELLQGLIVLAMVGLALFLAIMFGGPVGIAMRNYALMFYGGRYKVLGDTMFPPQTAGPGLPA